MAPLAQAQVLVNVFDNFGPGDTYDTIPAYTEGKTFLVGPTFSSGEGFVPTVSGSLDSVTVAIGQNDLGPGNPRPNDLHLFLSDGSSGTPGPVLESFVVTGLPLKEVHKLDPPEVIPSILHPVLTAGNLYFLYDREPENENNGWAENLTHAQGLHISSINDSPYTSRIAAQGAFRVTVIAGVPEPGCISLVTTLIFTGSLFAIRRLRNGNRL
jgi:hypothetical protein